MRHLHRHRAAIALASAILAIGAYPRSTAATDGWLDPTYSGNGWVRLGPPEFTHSTDRLTLAPDPGGQTRVVWELVGGESEPNVFAIALGSSGAPLASFNGGDWRFMVGPSDSRGLVGAFPTSNGGVVGVLGPDPDRNIFLRELGPTGTLVRSLTTGLGDDGFLFSNVPRLPGGSLRLCYTDEATDEHRLRGFTSAFQPDLTVGPAGERQVPMHCSHMGADAAGHIYLGLDADDAVDGEIHLLRTTTSGVVDTGWADSGQAIVSRATLGIAFPDESPSLGRAFGTAASPIATLPDGSLYLAARVTRDGAAWSAAIVKLTPDGSLDPGFDGDGIRAFGPNGGPSHIAAFTVDAQGRPIVSAVYGAPGARKAYLLRLTADGRFDVGFGRGGLIQQSFTATSLAVDGSGRILSAAGDGTNVIVARRSGG